MTRYVTGGIWGSEYALLEGELARYRKGPWPVALGTVGGIERALARQGSDRTAIFGD